MKSRQWFIYIGLLTVFAAAILIWYFFRSYDIENTAEKNLTEGMVLISGGRFQMGCADCKMDDALPVHAVELSSYWLDATPVTNKQFKLFADATGYKTVAERPLNPNEFPGVDPKNLVPGSIVFSPPSDKVDLTDFRNWWHYVPGASWKNPEGPQSNINGREDHPVVHIAYEDALAYATWMGKRLPTEAEYEFAARGGKENQKYAWGNELKLNAHWVANIWQGEFPNKNSLDDGFAGTSPVRQFPPNDFGLYDIGGNVWQWCSDWYRPDYYQFTSAQGSVTKNPKGPQTSIDPYELGLQKRVQRGGSFLCSDQYCERYLVGSRGKGEINSASSNVGFRCAMSE